jgi:hypothetical protein
MFPWPARGGERFETRLPRVQRRKRDTGSCRIALALGSCRHARLCARLLRSRIQKRLAGMEIASDQTTSASGRKSFASQGLYPAPPLEKGLWGNSRTCK